MKKLMILLAVAAATTGSVSAQTVAAPGQAQVAVPMTKEEKEAARQKKEADFSAAVKEAGLTDAQAIAVKAEMQATNTAANVIKKDAALSEDEKKAKLKEIKDASNGRIKEILGADTYKKWNAARKAQKEAAAPKS